MTDFAAEPLASAQAGIESLLPAHWQEFGDNDVEIKPNWQLYRNFEAHNGLVLIVAREGGTAVGFMVALVYPHVSAMGNLVAEVPTYFVRECATRGLILNHLMDALLKVLASRNVYKVQTWTAAKKSAGRLWERKGFEVDKIGYSMKLKSEHKNA